MVATHLVRLGKCPVAVHELVVDVDCASPSERRVRPRDEDGGKTKAIVLSTLRSRAEGGISGVAAMPVDVGPIRMGRMSSKGAGGFLDAAATIEPGKSHDNAVTKQKSENLATCRE